VRIDASLLSSRFHTRRFLCVAATIVAAHNPTHFRDSLLSSQVCSAGKYSVYDGTSSAGPTLCEDCEAGKYNNNPDSDDSDKDGHDNPDEDCIVCSVGKIQKNKGESSCESCEPGTFQSGSNHLSCALCDKGTYQSGSQQQSCNVCEIGKYINKAGSSYCLECSEGTYNQYDNSAANKDNHLSCTACLKTESPDEVGEVRLSEERGDGKLATLYPATKSARARIFM
jgi:hypothetical protein